MNNDNKTPEEMAEEYRKAWGDEQLYKIRHEHKRFEWSDALVDGFLAGYKAAQDQVLARFKSLLSSFAETSFNPNHTAWQIFDTLNENQAAQDQFADADKVMCSTTMEEIRAVDTGELMPITNLNQMHWPQKRISVEEAREMFPDKPPKEEK